MSARTPTGHTGIYQVANGSYQVAVQPSGGGKQPVWYTGFADEHVAIAFRAACEAANAAGVAHPDRDAFQALLAPAPVEPSAPLADIDSEHADDIDRATLRRALRGATDDFMAVSGAQDHSQRLRCRDLIDDALGECRVDDLTRAELDEFIRELAATWGQSTVNLAARVLTDALGWAQVHRITDHDLIGKRKLKARSSKPRTVKGAHKLGANSVASAALQTLADHPREVLAPADVAAKLIAAGHPLKAKGQRALARLISARLLEVSVQHTVPELQRVSKARYRWIPGYDPCPVHPDDRMLAEKRKIFGPRAILAVAARLPEKLLVLLWLTAILGLRPGEAMGLRISHFDCLLGLLRVRDQTGGYYRRRDRHGNYTVTRSKEGPKTESGYRNILLPPTLVAWLISYINRYHGADVWDDPEACENRIVVLPLKGLTKVIGRASWNKPLRRAMYDAGEGWRANGSLADGYDLRFTAASVLFDAIPETSRAGLLGHRLASDPHGSDITRWVYTGITADAEREASEFLEKYIQTELNGLMVDYGDLHEWVSTADAARMLGTTIDHSNNVLASFGVSVHPFDNLVWPLVRRAYRRDEVEVTLDRLDWELAMSLTDYAASTGLTRAQILELGTEGQLRVVRRAFRSDPGGTITSAKHKSVIVAEPCPRGPM